MILVIGFAQPSLASQECRGSLILTKATSETVKIDGRIVAYDAFIPNSNKETLIFLPGIYMGWGKQDKVLQILESRNANYIAINFSPHIASQIQANLSHANEINSITLQDMKAEIEAVIKKNKIKKPRFVSISFSSAVTSLFTAKDASLLIETAPMGDSNESDPSAKQADDSFKALSVFNPFMGMLYQGIKDSAYNTYWTNVVSRLKGTHPELKNLELFTRTVQAYTAMAKAVENYNILDIDFVAGPRRIFILGENEDGLRFELQMQAIKKYQEDRKEWPIVYLVRDSGHIIPEEAPEAYVEILADIAKRNSSKKSTPSADMPFFASVTHEGKIVWLSNVEAEKVFSHLKEKK
jgi:pimeloyl-ACP methyl ester carboxylesterase